MDMRKSREFYRDCLNSFETRLKKSCTRYMNDTCDFCMQTTMSHALLPIELAIYREKKRLFIFNATL